MNARGKTVLLSIMAILCGVMMPLFAMEVVLRFLPVATSTAAMAVDEHNPILHYTPNQEFIYSKGWRFGLVNFGRINNYGFSNDYDYTKHHDNGPIVIIGDSYVEALMVPFKETIQGRLALMAEQRQQVYSLGISGAQLAHYLALGEYAQNEFHPGAMIFVIVGNDFDESLTKYKDDPGYYHFEDAGDGREMRLIRLDYRPSFAKSLLRQSALARYLWRTVGIGSLPRVALSPWKLDSRYVGNTEAGASKERLADSRRIVDRFFVELPHRLRLDKSRILFVLDAMRPQIYSERDLEQAEDSYFAHMRQYFLETAHTNGYEVIDMEPRFISRHRRDGSRFEFAVDSHWNSLGHAEAATAIASSSMFRSLLSH